MKPLSYTHELASDALEICTNPANRYSRIDAIRDIDPKIDDKSLNIAQMMMVLLVTIQQENSDV